VATALRKCLQRDSTYRLATHGGADIALSGAITRYDRHELSLLPNDVLTVRDYRVNLTAQVMARETSTGKVLFTNSVTAYTLIRVGSDLASSERQAMPVLAEDLAKNVIALLVDGTW
jgi:urea transporter